MRKARPGWRGHRPTLQTLKSAFSIALAVVRVTNLRKSSHPACSEMAVGLHLWQVQRWNRLRSRGKKRPQKRPIWGERVSSWTGVQTWRGSPPIPVAPSRDPSLSLRYSSSSH